MNKNNKSIFSKVLFYLLVILIMLMMIIPVYLLIKISTAEPWEVLTQNPTLLPHSFTLEHWKNVLSSGNLWAQMGKSLRVAFMTTILAIIIVVPASYAISRFSKKVRYIFVLILFVTKMFPTVGIALPISVSFLKLGLLDKDIGLVLAHLISQVPFMAWILVTTFSAIPYTLDEAAMIDGASRWKALTKIIIPIALPGILVASMYVWLNSWNEFTYALYLSLSTKTLPLGVYYYVERGNTFLQAAYSTILTIPVLLITYFIQRYMTQDALDGAIKG